MSSISRESLELVLFALGDDGLAHASEVLTTIRGDDGIEEDEDVLLIALALHDCTELADRPLTYVEGKTILNLCDVSVREG